MSNAVRGMRCTSILTCGFVTALLLGGCSSSSSSSSGSGGSTGVPDGGGGTTGRGTGGSTTASGSSGATTILGGGGSTSLPGAGGSITVVDGATGTGGVVAIDAGLLGSGGVMGTGGTTTGTGGTKAGTGGTAAGTGGAAGSSGAHITVAGIGACIQTVTIVTTTLAICTEYLAGNESILSGASGACTSHGAVWADACPDGAVVGCKTSPGSEGVPGQIIHWSYLPNTCSSGTAINPDGSLVSPGAVDGGSSVDGGAEIDASLADVAIDGTSTTAIDAGPTCTVNSVAGAACNDLVNGGADITVVIGTDALGASSGTGGPIADGLYYLTGYKGYVGFYTSATQPATLRRTLQLCGGTGAYVDSGWTGTPLRQNFTYNPPSSKYLFPNNTCSSDGIQSAALDLKQQYTATPTTLTFFSYAGAYSLTFTKQ